MLTVINYHFRQNDQGEEFLSLELQSNDAEFVKSKNTGRFYATTRRCFMSATFAEPIAKKMIGRDVPGRIIKVDCEPYDFVIPETGEAVVLNYRYQYEPEENYVETTTEEAVFATA